MYIINGIAYAKESVNIIEIEHLEILEDRMLLLKFNNNEQRLFDTTLLVGNVYEPLKNDEIFLTATIKDGAVVWLNGEIDCAPEFMYENSHVYDEMFV